MRPSVDEQCVELCRHIVRWGERIPTFLANASYDDFVADEKVHLAVWKSVEVLGEASSKIIKIAPEFEAANPELQLKAAYAMRNRLTHGYSTVDLALLWTTAVNFVPGMVVAAKRIADAQPSGPVSRS